MSERPVHEGRLKSSLGPLKQSTVREIELSIPRVSVAFAWEIGRAENGLEPLVLCLFSIAFLQPGAFSCLSEALVRLVP